MQTFDLMPPEQVLRDYRYTITGTYTQENKAARQFSLAQTRAEYQGSPWLDELAFFDESMRAKDLNPESFKLPEAEQQQIQMMAQQLAQQQMAQAAETVQTEDKLAKLQNREDAKEITAASEMLDQQAADDAGMGINGPIPS